MLSQVGGDEVKEIIVVNKADIADPEVLDRLARTHRHSVVVSARTGAGLDVLAAMVDADLPKPDVVVELLLPYQRGDLLSRVHDHGEVVSVAHTEDGTRVLAKVHEHDLGELTAYLT